MSTITSALIDAIDSGFSNSSIENAETFYSALKKYQQRIIPWSSIKSLQHLKARGRPIGSLKHKKASPVPEYSEPVTPAKIQEEISPQRGVKRKSVDLEPPVAKKIHVDHCYSYPPCCLVDCHNTDKREGIKVGDPLHWAELFVCHDHKRYFKIYEEFEPKTPTIDELKKLQSSNETHQVEITNFTNDQTQSPKLDRFLMPDKIQLPATSLQNGLVWRWSTSKCFITCDVLFNNGISETDNRTLLIQHPVLESSEREFKMGQLKLGQKILRYPENKEYSIEETNYLGRIPKIVLKRCD